MTFNCLWGDILIDSGVVMIFLGTANFQLMTIATEDETGVLLTC